MRCRISWGKNRGKGVHPSAWADCGMSRWRRQSPVCATPHRRVCSICRHTRPRVSSQPAWTTLDARFLRSGPPEFFPTADLPEKRCQEWIDAGWVKDVLKLFRRERRVSFLRLLELLLTHGGGTCRKLRFGDATNR